jgi:hypothetical protein
VTPGKGRGKSVDKGELERLLSQKNEVLGKPLLTFFSRFRNYRQYEVWLKKQLSKAWLLDGILKGKRSEMSHGVISGVVPSIGFAISASRNGRTSLPVAPSMYIYSHFRHVSGVPAPEGTRGVTISKLKILDSLIEQLGRLKNQGKIDLLTDGEAEDRLDILISQYEQQLRQAQVLSATMPYSTASQASTGTVFNLVA